MKKIGSIKISFIVSMLITGLLVISSIWLSNSMYDNQRMEVDIGEKYLFSYFWDNEDPFYFPRVDTVRVIDIKNDYVLFEEVSFFNHQRSTTVKRFKHYARDIDVK